MTDNSTRAQALEILNDRADTYAFLAQVYGAELPADSLRALLKQLGDGEVAETDAGEGHALLSRFAFEAAQADLETVRRDLSAEFVRLFLGSRHDRIAPFESVYTSEEGLLMQKARDEVLAEYRSEGLDRVSDFNEPEDHLAIEFEFMAHLCRRAAEALEDQPEIARGYLEKQRAFVNQHLLVWVPRFCQDLAKRTESDFYRAIALITEEHLAQEHQTICELLTALPPDGED